MMPPEKLPNFLIIGAMKCGTTTLYRDLGANRHVYFPTDKELGNLTQDHVLTPEGRRQYARLFESSSLEQARGEASTAYSKLPDITGVPERALRVLGSDLRILYVVRHPVARAVSHHYHDYSYGLAHPDPNRDLLTKPQYVNFSSYARQIRPWIECFGREKVIVVKLEDYSRNRAAQLERVERFLGVPHELPPEQLTGVFNRGEARTIPGPLVQRLRSSPIYRDHIRPMLSAGVREKIRARVLSRSPMRPLQPSQQVLRELGARLREDCAAFSELVNEGAPFWNLDHVPPLSGEN